MERPLSRFPLRGQAGAGGFPLRRKHAARQQNTLSRIDATGYPHKRAAAPLWIPRSVVRSNERVTKVRLASDRAGRPPVCQKNERRLHKTLDTAFDSKQTTALGLQIAALELIA